MISAAGTERYPLFERRPALTLLLILVAGITFGDRLADPATYFPYIAGAACLGFAVAFAARRSPPLLVWCTAAGSFLFGIALITATRLADTHAYLANVAEGECKVNGVIGEVRQHDYLYFRLDCDSLSNEAGSHPTPDEAAGIFLRVTDSSDKVPLVRGMRVAVFGDLVKFSAQRNPYAFDHDRHLRTTEGIDAVLYCDSYYDIRVLGQPAPSAYESVLSVFDVLRSETKAAITSLIPDTLVRGFVLAMVLGEKRALPEEVWADFRAAGLSHILVVSGFNLGIIAWVFYILLRLLRLAQREVRIVLVMLGTLFYGALIGPQPSVIRAVIVVEFILLSRLIERRADLTNVTAGAALLTLVLDPSEAFNVSFQLSYVAVFSLTVLAPAFDRLLLPAREGAKRKWYDRSLKIVIGTAAVLVGTFPVVLFHFHQVSVIAIATNLITIPLASVATVLSILIIPLSLLSSAVTGIYVDAIDMVISLMSTVASVAGDISFAVIRLPHPSVFFMGVYVLALLYIIRAHTWQIAVARSSVALIITASTLSFGPALAASLFEKGVLTVMFFDVGQGDATLIATPNGKHYLVDAGGITRAGTSIAARSLMPALHAEGIDHIDGAFVTHMHLDHYGGFADLTRDLSIDTLYATGDKASTESARILDSNIYAAHLSVQRISAGSIIDLDDEVRAYILAPAEDNDESVNERSLVMKIVYRNASVLLPADIAAATEEHLVTRYGTFLKSDLTKVPHHGSRSSSAPAYVDLVAAQHAVVSAGRRNRHGHPDPEVVARWTGSGATVHRTDKHGAFIFRSAGEAFTEVAWR